MHPRRAVLPPVAFLLLTIGAVANVLGALAFIPDRGSDFSLLYQSTESWLHGLPPYVSAQPTTNLNHPLLWIVIAPFTMLPESRAFLAWTLVSLVLFALAADRVSGVVGVAMREIVVITLSLTGTVFGLALGQVGLILMVPVTIAWYLWRNGRTTGAGACLGLICVLKPFFGLFLVMLIARRAWQAVLSFSAAAVGAVVAGWLLAGTAGYVAWFANLRHVTWTWHIFNASVWGIGARLFGPQVPPSATEWTPLAMSPLASVTVGVVGVLITVIMLARALPRADADHAFALVALGSLLVSPLGWTYYLATMCAPVLAVLARQRSQWLWLLGAAASCPYALLVNRHYGKVGTVIAGQLSFATVAALFTVVYLSARGQSGGR